MQEREEAEIIGRTRIGIVGGGQLGLMLGEAARKMGYAEVTVLDPTPQSPASVVAEQIVGSLRDEEALQRLAERSDILTYEIEHINTEALQHLQERGVKMYPAPTLLATIQNKYEQKVFLEGHGIEVAPFLSLEKREDIEEAVRRWGYPLVLKAKKDAYDGRGNARINRAEDIEEAYAKLGGRELYVEKGIALEKELGIMVARNVRGENALFPVVEMIHARDICQTVIAPAQVGADVQEEVRRVALASIDALEGIGIFGVELFLDKEGKTWLNEIAPRPHNLGHYTIEACETSQFEEHLRAVTNLRLTGTGMKYPVAVMENILGERNGVAEPHWSSDYDHEHVFPHIYGKRETKVDRKMGHITVVGDDVEEVYRKAKAARASFSI
jgi:5-(carboxyamino)imidazole ribonucleotide synthase